MAHDVFISYSSKDKPIADAVLANLEQNNIRCWIAPRDITPGSDWPTAITDAIVHSRIMVLIFSSNSNSSHDVGRELILAANNNLVIIPFKIDNVVPEPGKLYYLARTHWLDAINPPTQRQIDALVSYTHSFLKDRLVAEPQVAERPVRSQPAKTSLSKKKGLLWVAGALVLVAAISLYLLLQEKPGEKTQVQVETQITQTAVVVASVTQPATITVRIADSTQTPELGTEENPIIWAVVPTGETELVVAGFEQVTKILFDETGLVIKPLAVTEYADVIEALASDPPKAHMASLATLAYILAADKGVAQAELVAEHEGNAVYNSQIFTRKDSGLNTIADLKGKSFCRPGLLSNSGWIIPSITLKAAGINLYFDLTTVDVGSHAAAVTGVYNGDCDAGASFVDARSMVEGDLPDVMDVIQVIDVSVDIPNDGVQYHPTLPKEMREKINAALIAMGSTEAGAAALLEANQWDSFAVYDDTFYDPFRQILDAAGVDIQDLQ